MKGATRRRFLNGALGLSAVPALGFAQKGTHAAGERHRVLVSTDIGGSGGDYPGRQDVERGVDIPIRA